MVKDFYFFLNLNRLETHIQFCFFALFILSSLKENKIIHSSHFQAKNISCSWSNLYWRSRCCWNRKETRCKKNLSRNWKEEPAKILDWRLNSWVTIVLGTKTRTGQHGNKKGWCLNKSLEWPCQIPLVDSQKNV